MTRIIYCDFVDLSYAINLACRNIHNSLNRSTCTSVIFDFTESGFFLVGDNFNNRIVKVDKDTEIVTEIPMPGTLDDVDYDPLEDRVYWTDYSGTSYPISIESCYLNGTDRSVLYRNTSKYKIAKVS